MSDKTDFDWESREGGGIRVWIIALIILVVFCAIKWAKWYISSTALIYYIKKKRYRLPSDEDMEECTAFVAKHLFR